MKLSRALFLVYARTCFSADDCSAQQPLQQQDSVLLQAKAVTVKVGSSQSKSKETSDSEQAKSEETEAAEIANEALQRREHLKQELALLVSKRNDMRAEAIQRASAEKVIRSDCSNCDDGGCPGDCVACGGHWASGCEGCPQGNKWNWCHGDCWWQGGTDGQCVLATSVSSGRLLVAAEGTGDIKRANSDGSELRTFLPGNTPCESFAGSPTQHLADSMTSRPTGLAVDEVAGFVFWTDHFGGSRVMAVNPDEDEYGRTDYRWGFGASVNRAPIGGGLVTPIVTSGEVLQDPAYEPILWEPSVELTWPHFLDLDRINQKVYWTDRLDQRVQRSNYDGTEFERDFLETEGEAGGIAVDADAGFVYFSDYVPEGHVGYVIKRASLASGAPEVLLGAAGPIKGLALDLARSHIYFAADGTARNPGGIMRAGISDSSRRRGKYGITYSTRAYDSASDAEHVVLLPRGRQGTGRRRAAVSAPVGVAGDWERGHLYWTGSEGLAAQNGLGGRVYRSSLCEDDLPRAHRRRRGGGRSEGDMDVVVDLQGDPLAAPFPGALAILSEGAVDASGTVPGPACKPDVAGGFSVPADADFVAPDCVDLPDWSSSTGARCSDYQRNDWCTEDGEAGSGWGGDWGSIESYATDGLSAFDACCTCGGARV